MTDTYNATIRVKLNLKTGEILEKEIMGYSSKQILWAPLIEMLYEEIKKLEEAA